MRSLVAAPAHSCKDYAIDKWAAATSQYDRLVAVDSEDVDYVKRLNDYGIRSVVYQKTEDTIYGPLFTKAWRTIVDNAEGYTHILSLDVDVIPSGDILKLMESQYDQRVSFLRHGVPWREVYRRKGCTYEMSCTFALVSDWERAVEFSEKSEGKFRLYEIVGHPSFYTHKDIYLMELEHMDDGIDRR